MKYLLVQAEAAEQSVLPPSFEADKSITLRSTEPMTLAQISDRLTKITGLPTIVSLGPDGNGQVEEEASVAFNPATAVTTPNYAGRLSSIVRNCDGFS